MLVTWPWSILTKERYRICFFDLKKECQTFLNILALSNCLLDQCQTMLKEQKIMFLSLQKLERTPLPSIHRPTKQKYYGQKWEENYFKLWHFIVVIYFLFFFSLSQSQAWALSIQLATCCFPKKQHTRPRRRRAKQSDFSGKGGKMIGKMLHHKYRRRGSGGLGCCWRCHGPACFLHACRFRWWDFYYYHYWTMALPLWCLSVKPCAPALCVCVCGSYERLLVS